MHSLLIDQTESGFSEYVSLETFKEELDKLNESIMKRDLKESQIVSIAQKIRIPKRKRL